ncbi:MAG: general secretion pathway protein GspB [Candidatus Omnitrophica bacterium]|nr:general secretion pathway protein GspB [Candidatus Omnitrophota bacterium]
MKNVMRTVFVVLFLSSGVIFALAETVAEKSSLPDISIEGILFDENNPMVVINGRTLRIGDNIEGAEIVEITENGVKFDFQGNFYTKTLNVGKPGPVIRKQESFFEKVKKSLSKFFTKEKSPTEQINASKVSRFQRHKELAYRYSRDAQKRSRSDPVGAAALYGKAHREAQMAYKAVPGKGKYADIERKKMFNLANDCLEQQEACQRLMR